MKKAMLINPSGFVEMVEWPEGEQLQWYYKMLDCDLVTFVQPYGMEALAEEHGLGSYVGEYCLICDDEALLREEPHANPVASLLYGVLDHGQALFGKVLVAKNDESTDGLDTVGLDENDVQKVRAAIDALIASCGARARGGGD